MSAKKKSVSLPFPQNAELPARSIPFDALEPGARKILTAFADANTGEKLAVACSGGADSVAALLLVRAHFPALRKKIVVLNFNHGTRPECAREAAFVKQIADALGERFVGGKIQNKRAAGKSEESLRRERLAFFRRAMKTHQCRILIQGHHAGDVVETALMRLARGSGTAGLCAPRPVQKFADGTLFLRPLLCVEKEKIVSALRDAGLSWCEDASNAGDDYLRNRLRNTVVPAWTRAQKISPGAGVLRTRKLLEEDDDALEAWLDNCLGENAHNNCLGGGTHLACGVRHLAERKKPPANKTVAGANADNDTQDARPPRDKETPAVFKFSRLKNLPRALHRRALWRVLLEIGLEKHVSAPLADEIVDALAGGNPLKRSVGKQFLIFDGDTLRVSPAKTKTKKPARETIALPTDAAGKKRRQTAKNFAVERLAPAPGVFQKIVAGKIPPTREVFLNATALAGNALRVRPLRAGDAYRPLGAPGTRKVSDIFIDKKIPEERRHALPIVCDAEGIVWIPGLPPAHRCRLQNAGNAPLRLTWLAGDIPSHVLKNESATAKQSPPKAAKAGCARTF